jgi:hypothetical protein
MEKIELLNGELSTKDAPHVKLDDGRLCIPQHYLKYQHTLATVAELVLKLIYCDVFPIFAAEDKNGIYIQVGIIDADNYSQSYAQSYVPGDTESYIQANNNHLANNIEATDVKDKNVKIMYGRKWRVEPKLPTSEIVQTVFLALKIAREHEIRERFRLSVFNKMTTPFNNHHDMTLLKNSDETLKRDEKEKTWPELQYELNNISYDHATFNIINMEHRHQEFWLLELKVSTSQNTTLPELSQDQILVLVLAKPTFNDLCYQLITKLILLSNRHVDEHFTYECVARFSQQNNIKEIAKISANTRELHKLSKEPNFEQRWRNDNYQVDLTRVPQLNQSVLSKRITDLLNSYKDIGGIKPNLVHK